MGKVSSVEPWKPESIWHILKVKANPVWGPDSVRGAGDKVGDGA